MILKMYMQYKDFIHTFLKWYTWFRHKLKLHPGAQFANKFQRKFFYKQICCVRRSNTKYTKS